ncbi:MAG: cytidylyltransferase domain-containing protein [Oceanicaulis sp.]
MTVAAIVQARIGSTRLPGKVLEYLGRRTALARCLDRTRAIAGVDLVVCAVPDSPENDPVAEEAADCGAMVVRGDEQDVLARYAKAAREAEATVVMRITSDCPFIDPVISAGVLSLLKDTAADYASNSAPPLFPHGLDCEAFPASLLYEADRRARAAYEREHVTPWIRLNTGFSQVNLRGPGGGLERLRWTLDRPEDLAFFRAVFDELGERAATASAAEIAGLCLRRPDIAQINAAAADEARLQTRYPTTRQTPPVPLALAA